MAFLVSALASSIAESHATEGEERISPLTVVSFFNAVFVLGWLFLIAVG